MDRIHGWDVNGAAVRVAVFSMYVALLEEVSPPDIRLLIKRGKLLPDLWGKTLVCRDFFEAPETENDYAVVFGNPPWSSRRGSRRSSVRWCQKNDVPMPGGEDAWAFVWKGLRHITNEGILAFLVPAMGFLHNHADNSVAARNALICHSRIRRIINFADLRFQLFEGAVRPAALFLLSKTQATDTPYRFDYWAPKADLNLQIKRFITLSSMDKFSLGSTVAVNDPLVFKRKLWMREPESKLFSYLSRLPPLESFIQDYASVSRRKENVAERWIIGQGFQPNNDSEDTYFVSQYVGKFPDIPITAFRRFAQPITKLPPWLSRRVRRKGFEAGFSGARILVPRGVETSQMRLRATYLDRPATFQHILQAITVPKGDETTGKLLAALLNSRVALWFAFHGTASFGSDRPEVQQAELLRLPFPRPADLPNPSQAQLAAASLVAIIDEAIIRASEPQALEPAEEDILASVDKLAYRYFCLSEDEMVLIEDAVSRIFPAVQPHQGSFPEIWGSPTPDERSNYANTLVRSLSDWFKDGGVSAELEACAADLGILRLSLGRDGTTVVQVDRPKNRFDEVLARIAEHIHQPLDGNFQLMPDLRIIVGMDLYLFKPMQRRFWLRSAALADADAIAMDLQDAREIELRRGLA
jgi:hypothetical protein